MNFMALLQMLQKLKLRQPLSQTQADLGPYFAATLGSQKRPYFHDQGQSNFGQGDEG